MTLRHEHEALEDVYFEGTDDAHCSAGSEIPTEPVLQPWELRESLAALTPKQRFVVERSWGIAGDGTQHSFQEIADSMGIKRQSAHELYTNGMERLRALTNGSR